MSISSDLITLSSCNSAKGKVEEGIGIVSLSNAFYFAGVPATVSSLWSAQDKSSSEIMANFYQNLANGDTKSESLRKAKLAYLKGADKLKSQPFFWANYVLFGNDTPLFEAEKKTPWYSYVIGLVVAVALFFVGRSYFKSLNKA
jgi:CHAT domain-containing protein